jgi:hypothetical protein
MLIITHGAGCIKSVTFSNLKIPLAALLFHHLRLSTLKHHTCIANLTRGTTVAGRNFTFGNYLGGIGIDPIFSPASPLFNADVATKVSRGYSAASWHISDARCDMSDTQHHVHPDIL